MRWITIALLVVAVLSLLASSKVPARSEMMPMAMPLVAPVFLEDDVFGSTLVLVNASSENTFATLTLRSPRGNIIERREISLGPSAERSVAIRDLLSEASSAETRGSIVVEQSPELKGMAVLAQLSITYRKYPQLSFIDEELAMPDPMGSQVLRGVGRDWGAGTAVWITSLSQSSQDVRIDCLTRRGKSRSKVVSLAPGATVQTTACEKEDSGTSSIEFAGGDGEEREPVALGIQLTSTAAPGEFAAYGLSKRRVHGRLTFDAVSFADPMMSHSSSTVYAGVAAGPTSLFNGVSYKPLLGLANFGAKPAHVKVSFGHTTGSVQAGSSSSAVVRDMTLQPQQAVSLALSELQGDPDMRNSLVVASDADAGELVSNLVSVGDQQGDLQVGLLGKDSADPQNAGAHPWSIANQSDSTLFLFNHTDQEQRSVVTIVNGRALWEKSVVLGTSETSSLSIRELVEQGIKDDSGRILPRELADGEIIWTSTAGTITGRLLVSNRLTGMARNFSCGAYVVLCGVSISPTSATMPVGGSAAFTGNATECIGYTPNSCSGAGSAGGMSVSYSWNGSTQVSTTGCSGQSCSATAMSPGSGWVTVTAQLSVFNGCSFSASAPVTVKPRIDSISPSGGLIGATVSVTINGSGFGTSPTVNAGTGITVTVNSANNSQIQASFNISASAPAGNHSVTVTAGGQTSDPKNFFVQVSTYFFSPSAVQTAMPPACVQADFMGYFIDVSYYVADQNSGRVSQSGMAPGENVGSGWNDAFATPTTTKSDGSFNDTPNGSCYGTSGHFCAVANPQSFRLTNNGQVFSIMTNTTRRTCTDGIQLVIQGNPFAQNKTYTFGNTQ